MSADDPEFVAFVVVVGQSLLCLSCSLLFNPSLSADREKCHLEQPITFENNFSTKQELIQGIFEGGLLDRF